eukprot:gene3842-2722_t
MFARMFVVCVVVTMVMHYLCHCALVSFFQLASILLIIKESTRNRNNEQNSCALLGDFLFAFPRIHRSQEKNVFCRPDAHTQEWMTNLFNKQRRHILSLTASLPPLQHIIVVHEVAAGNEAKDPLLIPQQLQHIKRLSQDSAGADHAGGGASSPTHVHVHVRGTPGRAGGGSSSSAVIFECPVFMLQSASPHLAEQLVEDLLLPDASSSPRDHSGSDTNGSLSIQLPSIDAEVFETVALYMEHFYGVHCALQDRTEQEHKQQRNFLGEGGALENIRPTVLRPPLQLQDLYGLQSWEVCFVWQRLLQLPQLVSQRFQGSRRTMSTSAPASSGAPPTGSWDSTDVRRVVLQLAQHSRWVDVMAASQLGPNGGGVPPVATALPHAGQQSPESLLYFTLEEKQGMLQRLFAVLEAAGQLRMASLHALCAALVANMLVDLPEEEIRRLLARDHLGKAHPGNQGSGAPPSVLPSLSEERRQQLYQRYPWVNVRPAPTPKQQPTRVNMKAKTPPQQQQAAGEETEKEEAIDSSPERGGGGGGFGAGGTTDQNLDLCLAVRWTARKRESRYRLTLLCLTLLAPDARQMIYRAVAPMHAGRRMDLDSKHFLHTLKHSPASNEASLSLSMRRFLFVPAVVAALPSSPVLLTRCVIATRSSSSSSSSKTWASLPSCSSLRRHVPARSGILLSSTEASKGLLPCSSISRRWCVSTPPAAPPPAPALEHEKVEKGEQARASDQQLIFAALQEPAAQKPSTMGGPGIGPAHGEMVAAFTCGQCDFRMVKRFSKHAYTKGIVVVECPNCRVKHLLADNLGWWESEATTIEDILKEKGEKFIHLGGGDYQAFGGGETREGGGGVEMEGSADPPKATPTASVSECVCVTYDTYICFLLLFALMVISYSFVLQDDVAVGHYFNATAPFFCMAEEIGKRRTRRVEWLVAHCMYTHPSSGREAGQLETKVDSACVGGLHCFQPPFLPPSSFLFFVSKCIDIGQKDEERKQEQESLPFLSLAFSFFLLRRFSFQSFGVLWVLGLQQRFLCSPPVSYHNLITGTFQCGTTPSLLLRRLSTHWSFSCVVVVVVVVVVVSLERLVARSVRSIIDGLLDSIIQSVTSWFVRNVVVSRRSRLRFSHRREVKYGTVLSLCVKHGVLCCFLLLWLFISFPIDFAVSRSFPFYPFYSKKRGIEEERGTKTKRRKITEKKLILFSLSSFILSFHTDIQKTIYIYIYIYIYI